MRSAQWLSSVGLCCALVSGAVDQARASLTIASGLGTTHVGNLVLNGSFETGSPPNGTANELYWATGTSLTPFAVDRKSVV